jgi:predicted metal-dependent peptidase
MSMDMRQIISTAENMTTKEWTEICHLLREHHSLFYKIWEMGKPMFSQSIPTACVTFDPSGNYLAFLFNPDFWNSLDNYNKLFVICHESIHVIFNHGYRFKDSKDKHKSNLAMDVVVNHTLTNQFGFDRNKIKDWESLCWVDTLFKGMKYKGFSIRESETVEFYLELLRKKQSKQQKQPQGGGNQSQKSDGNGDGSQGQGQDQDQGQGQGQDQPRTLDQHEFSSGNSDSDSTVPDFSKLADLVSQSLSESEANGVANVFNKHKDPNTSPLKPAGTGHGNMTHTAQQDTLVNKKKWETVVKRWTAKQLKESDKDVEQWARKHRRFNMLGDTLFLPSDMDVDAWNYEKAKLKVHFYLDTSGSCWNLKDRFFSIAASLPKRKFDVDLFCFDTEVVATSLETRKIHGGGGTSFYILEQYIQNLIKNSPKNGKKFTYPDAVWVLTDGYGDSVKIEKPENWYWFIDAPTKELFKNVCKSYIPQKCNTFHLGDFV